MAGFKEMFGDWEEPVAVGDFELLPAGTRVLAELMEVKTATFDGRISPETVWKVQQIQAGVPAANYGHPRIWDKFKLKFPRPAFSMAGQPDEAVSKWKAEKAIWARSMAAVFMPEVPVKEAIEAFLTCLPTGSEAEVQNALASRVGKTVIIEVSADPAGREYTDNNGDKKKTQKGKNGVKYYEADTPANRTKYGFNAAGGQVGF